MPTTLTQLRSLSRSLSLSVADCRAVFRERVWSLIRVPGRGYSGPIGLCKLQRERLSVAVVFHTNGPTDERQMQRTTPCFSNIFIHTHTHTHTHMTSITSGNWNWIRRKMVTEKGGGGGASQPECPRLQKRLIRPVLLLAGTMTPSSSIKSSRTWEGEVENNTHTHIQSLFVLY